MSERFAIIDYGTKWVAYNKALGKRFESEHKNQLVALIRNELDAAFVRIRRNKLIVVIKVIEK